MDAGEGALEGGASRPAEEDDRAERDPEEDERPGAPGGKGLERDPTLHDTRLSPFG